MFILRSYKKININFQLIILKQLNSISVLFFSDNLIMNLMVFDSQSIYIFFLFQYINNNIVFFCMYDWYRWFAKLKLYVCDSVYICFFHRQATAWNLYVKIAGSYGHDVETKKKKNLHTICISRSTAAANRVVIRSVTNRMSTYATHIHVRQLISSGIIKAILTSH